MKKNILVKSVLIFAFIFTSCSTNKKIESDDDFSVEGAAAPVGSDEIGSTSDDLALEDSAEKPAETAKSEKAEGGDNLDSALETELNSLGNTTADKAAEKTAAAPQP